MCCGTTSATAQRAADPRPAEPAVLRAPRPQAGNAARDAQHGGAALPQVLAPADAASLRRVFDLQAQGDLTGAAREADRLIDRRLLGHVLADRFLRAAPPLPERLAGGIPASPVAADAQVGGVQAGDLQAWLAQYADHPDARRLHDLLGRLAPQGAALPAPPATPDALSPDASLAPEDREPAGAAVVRNAVLDRAVRDRAREGNAAAGLALIDRARGLGHGYATLLRAELAVGLFRAGRDDEALRIAAAAARPADAAQPASAGAAQAAYAAGLAAWGGGHYDIALPFFERAARAAAAAPALRSAAAFWTARAAVRARQPQLYVTWMLQAAQEPRTFHGLVARRALGLPPGFAWNRDLPGEAEAAAVAETAGGWRALALLQVGQRGRAEAELRQLWAQARNNPGLVRSMLAVASQAGLPGLAAQLAGASQTADGRPRDYARFPLPPLLPQGGFRVDPALLYGLALQESRLDPAAISPAGARGLMQLMPATASFVANDPELRGAAMHRLHDPAFSLELAQRYVHHLATHEAVDGNLIRLLAAYNAGPGNLAKWLPASGHRDDPFLFIESIPIDETREFVQRVLAYSWIYASRLGLLTPSLDRLVAGGFPRFAGTAEVAAMLRQGVGGQARAVR